MVLSALLEEGRAAGAFPMAAAAVLGPDGVRATGFAGGADAATSWDLASLTKPRVVVTECMRGVSAGTLDLDEPVALDGGALPAHVTVRALLGHRAGLAAWKDLVKDLPPGFAPGSPATRAAVAEMLRAAVRASDPGRAAHGPAEYSDLGFILLGWHLEARTGHALDALAPGYPGLHAADVARYAPTGLCPWRGRHLQGEVHDPNAWALGGVAGHAGQFGTLGDVAAWARGLLALALAADDAPPAGLAPELAGIAPRVVRSFWDLGARDPQGTWVLGWDTPSREGSSAGARMSPSAVGHLGFTGTSVWIDCSAEQAFVLLTNRVALGPGAQPALRAFRPRFHDAARALASDPR